MLIYLLICLCVCRQRFRKLFANVAREGRLEMVKYLVDVLKFDVNAKDSVSHVHAHARLAFVR
jgi:hypothetical protein